MFSEQLPPNCSMRVEFVDVEFPFGCGFSLCCRQLSKMEHIFSSANGRQGMVLQEKQGQISITNTGNKGSPRTWEHQGIDFIFVHYNFKYVPKAVYFFHPYLEALQVHKCDYFQSQISHETASSISEQMDEHFLFLSIVCWAVQHLINKEASLVLGN